MPSIFTTKLAGLSGQKTKKVLPERESYFLILNAYGKVALEQRENNGIWGGLYCFPQFESKAALLAFLAAQGIGYYQEWTAFRHTFSHFHLDIYPIYVELQRSQADQNRTDWKKSQKRPNRVNQLYSVRSNIGMIRKIQNKLDWQHQ